MIKSILLASAFSFSLLGSPASFIGPRFDPEYSMDTKCALPAPKNVHLVSIGSTFFQVAWDPVEGAAYYRIKAYKASTGTLASTKLVPALPENNLNIVGNLELGQEYYIYIYSVCSNGIESPKIF